jgi:hypothetical protein
MKIVKVNKSQRVGLRGNYHTDGRTYQSKMMVELGENDMVRIFKYRQLDNESSQKHNGTNVLESVESLIVENELTDYLNQKLNNQISYKLDWSDEKIEEFQKTEGFKIDKERRFDDTELVVFRIKRKDRHKVVYNDSIDMKNHLGINDKEVK